MAEKNKYLGHLNRMADKMEEAAVDNEAIKKVVSKTEDIVE